MGYVCEPSITICLHDKSQDGSSGQEGADPPPRDDLSRVGERTSDTTQDTLMITAPVGSDPPPPDDLSSVGESTSDGTSDTLTAQISPDPPPPDDLSPVEEEKSDTASKCDGNRILGLFTCSTALPSQPTAEVPAEIGADDIIELMNF